MVSISQERANNGSRRTAAPPLVRRRALRQAQGKLCQKCAIIEKELSSATHIAEGSDGGWPHRGASRKPPRLVAGPAAADLPPRRGVSQTVGRVS